MRPFGKQLKRLTEGSQSSRFSDMLLLPELLEHQQERISLSASDATQDMSIRSKHPQAV